MAIPTNGLVFYAPLASNAETAETGQTISWYNSPTFPVINDIPCFYSDSKSYMKIVNVDTLRTAYNSGVFTISFWAQNLKSTSRRSCICFNGSGNYKTEKVLLFGPYKIDQADTSLWGPKDSEEADVDIDHFCYVVNSNNISVYINSELITTVTCETPVISASNALTISGIPQGWNYTSAPTSEKYNGFVSSIRVYNRALSAAEITELSKEFADEGTSGGTGVVIDGLFLSTSKPTANQKGLLVNNKFFIPFAESSEGGSGGDTSAFESDAMAIIGTPTEEGGDIEPISQKYMTVTSTDDVGCGVGIEFTGTIQIVEDGVATLYTTSPISNIALRNATVYGDNITYFNCGSTNLASVDPSHNDQLVTLICSNGYLTALDISNNSLLTTLEANSNNLSSAVVDKILSDLVAHGKSNGLLRLENSAGIGAASNGAPTSQNNVTTLQSRGWTVTTA